MSCHFMETTFIYGWFSCRDQHFVLCLQVEPSVLFFPADFLFLIIKSCGCGSLRSHCGTESKYPPPPPPPLPQCDQWVFLSSAALEVRGRSCTVTLRRLWGIKLQGLEIAWTNRALSRYLCLNRVTPPSFPPQNAALGRLRGAQTAAHPLSSLVLSRHDRASHLSRILVRDVAAGAHVPQAEQWREESDAGLHMHTYAGEVRSSRFTPVGRSFYR